MYRYRNQTSLFSLLTIMLICMLSSSIYGQEICNNGIDDDGNGLTDYQEEACECGQAITTTIYGDFEDYSCCPQNFTGADTGIGCLTDGWQEVGLPTSDYFNTCGYMGGQGWLPSPPLPLPSGEGVVGFAVSNGYGEYVGKCLDYEMTAGESYDVEFWLGFKEYTSAAISSEFPTEISIFGFDDCAKLDENPTGCLTSTGWIVMETVVVTTTMDSSWTQVNFSFSPDSNVCAFAIGPACSTLAGNLNYYFLDNLSISGDFYTKDTNGLPEITLTGDCISGVELEVNEPDGIEFQWYLDGIAIPGETNSTIDLTIPYQVGDYSVYVDFGTTCGVTNIFPVDIDLDVLNIDGVSVNNPCFGDELGAITLNLPTANLPLDIIWSNGETTGDLDNLPDGDYEVTVTDSNGCYGSAFFSITSPTALIGNISDITHPTQNYAYGGATANISGGNPPYNFSWTSLETYNPAVLLEAGTNYVTVTDDNDCEIILEVEINPTLEIDALIENATCFEDCDGSIELLIYGGLPPYDIQWGFGASSSTLPNLCADNYMVTITDQVGTELILDLEVIENGEIFIDGMLDDIICGNEPNGYIQTIIAGGTPDYTFLWNTGDTTQDLNDIPAGTYQITVTDEVGCTSSNEFVINSTTPFTYQSIVTNTSCDGGSTGSIILNSIVGESPFQFIWSNGETTQDITDLTSGIYAVTITDNLGCEQIDQFTINENSGITVVEQIQNVSCPGLNDGSILLVLNGGSGANSITWPSLGQSGSLVTDLPSGDYAVEIVDANNCIWNGIYTISENNPVEVIEQISDVICFGDNTGAISLDINGGTAPYNLSWNSGETSSDINNLVAGTYTVEIIDADNCNYQFDYIVQDGYQLMMQSPIVTNASCDNAFSGAIDLTFINGAPPISFSWSNGAVTEDLNFIQAGEYQFVATDGNLCTLSETITVSQDSNLEINVIVEPTNCFDSQDGSISITILSGTGPFDFLWNNGETGMDLFNQPAGNYSVTITDANNCELIESFIIDSSTPLAYQFAIEQPTCDLGGSINVITSNPGSLSFQWSNGQTSSQISNLNADTYLVTITDSNNCEYFDQAILIEPICDLIINIDDQEIACFENDAMIEIEIIGGSDPFMYNLSNITFGTFVSGTLTTPPYVITNLTEGLYEIEIISSSGEIGLATFEISQQLAPTLQLMSTTDFNGFDIDCFGNNTGAVSAIIQNGTSPFQLTWSNGDTDQNIENLSSGEYSLTVTDSNNCSTEHTIELIEPPILVSEVNFTDPNCSDPMSGSISIQTSGGTPPYQFGLNGNSLQNEDNFNNLPAASYFINVFDANNCAISSQVILSPSLGISVDLGIDQTILLGESISLEGIPSLNNAMIDTIIWTGISNDLCENCIEQLISPEITTVYSVLIIDEDGCTASDEITIFVEIPKIKIFVANVFSPNGDGFNDLFFPMTNTDDSQIINSFIIFDRWGEQVFIQENFISTEPNIGWDGTWNGKNLNPGVFVYVLNYEANDERIQLKGDLTLVR